MLVLITGGCKNGKSSKAEKMAYELSKGQNLYYLATMIPSDTEDEERIKKHIGSRQNMPFTTIEKGRDVLEATDLIPENATVLLDSLTALLSNEMFKISENGDFKFCGDADQKVYSDVCHLGSHITNLIIVSDYIQSDFGQYDGYTDRFREGLAFLEYRLSLVSDKAIEVVAGKEMDIKQKNNPDNETQKERVLVIGGAYQGKRNFVTKKFGISPKDIYVCDENTAEIPKGYRCYEHVEKYVLSCVKKDSVPVQEFEKGTIIIFDDIFCGVVPIDELIRRYREAAGRFVQQLADGADVYRVFCGRGIKL
ncbi:MAG: bifunctional adenosylcobinamide kinase/adenosylcobinamide-phosphate guanylyltransferase [Butyrivibrio sp.]|uniref:bifunctional adenosylcobinamide kinase/adenosylcobinamide-phosphate guanylyltransferase n=1 Tax=Butyrivibrio sp. TaxID=28121 RepID=UPI001B119B14|nr:bifunctional adenosylcobinamide kinase/adenosylcobinamide-phosphate guanylyltransferase [Butyrivibrio sp.]MBO6240804.1 bifunctional adenosylcobinamide kinase/adenosylcobinamide-phosphate guanylyltransferase [Butyrivibrio sp.]